MQYGEPFNTIVCILFMSNVKKKSPLFPWHVRCQIRKQTILKYEIKMNIEWRLVTDGYVLAWVSTRCYKTFSNVNFIWLTFQSYVFGFNSSRTHNTHSIGIRGCVSFWLRDLYLYNTKNPSILSFVYLHVQRKSVINSTRNDDHIASYYFNANPFVIFTKNC